VRSLNLNLNLLCFLALKRIMYLLQYRRTSHRLTEEIKRPIPQGNLRRILRAVAGNHDDLCHRVGLPYSPQHFQAIHAWESEIKEHEIWSMGLEEFQASRTVGCHNNFEALANEQVLHNTQYHLVIIDYQNSAQGFRFTL